MRTPNTSLLVTSARWMYKKKCERGTYDFQYRGSMEVYGGDFYCAISFDPGKFRLAYATDVYNFYLGICPSLTILS